MEDARNCVCCGGTTKPTGVLNRSFSSEYVQCEKCRHIQLAAFPDNDELDSFYETYSENRILSDSLITEYQKRADAQVKYVFECLPLRQENGVRVCDIGCGYGFLLKAFSHMVSKCVGIEVDAKCREYIKNTNKNISVLPPQHGLDSPLDILKGFTLICMSHYLEHERHCDDLIGNLSVHGCKYVFIEVPSEVNFFTGHLDDAHIHHFNSNSLALLLNNNGYEVLDIGYYGSSRVLPTDFMGRVRRKLARMFRSSDFHTFYNKNDKGIYLRAVGKLRQTMSW